MNSISTHVLDTSRGLPVAGIPVSLSILDAGAWAPLSAEVTDADGRATLAEAGSTLAAGRYRVHFAIEHGPAETKGWYPEVSIVVDLRPGVAHTHVPLLLSPFGYTTYRGS